MSECVWKTQKRKKIWRKKKEDVRKEEEDIKKVVNGQRGAWRSSRDCCLNVKQKGSK